MDFDPRDIDTRERDDFHVEEVRWGDDPRDIDDREREFDRERDPKDHTLRLTAVTEYLLPRAMKRYRVIEISMLQRFEPSLRTAENYL
jgi:hypothetical protein